MLQVVLHAGFGFFYGGLRLFSRAKVRKPEHAVVFIRLAQSFCQEVFLELPAGFV